MRTQLILLSAALLAPGAHARPTDPPPTALVAPLAGEDVEALEREFEQASDAFKQELRRLKGKERAEFSKHKPTVAFWPRFEALADSGDGRALFWMARHARERGLSISEGRDLTKQLYTRLVTEHAGADWCGEVIEALPRARGSIGSEAIVAGLRKVVDQNESVEIQASALAGLVTELRRSKSPEALEEAERIVDRLAAEYAETEVGAKIVAERQLAVGKVAPDFTGTTIDGYEFDLTDYRGKVVLIDFYGFW